MTSPAPSSRRLASESASGVSGSATTRRHFLQAGAVGSLLAGVGGLPGAYAAGNDIIRIGLVGCGDRGTGAASQALMADPQTRLVAMGDAFPEQIERKLSFLQRQKNFGDRVDVPQELQFAGLDCYKPVIDNCDVVLLASPPGFRPQHMKYAVEQGKHIFCEKPVATDAPGLRSVIESVKVAREKNLSLVSGFCWRYDPNKAALFEKILSGTIGDVLCHYTTYLASPVKPMPPESERPAGMSDVEWMVRNWYNFAGLSGDLLVEQAIHAVDWLGWAKGDTLPVSCVAVGGKQQTHSKGGDIYDHFSVTYEWEDGSRGFIHQRQGSGCYNENTSQLLGTKGQGWNLGQGVKITGAENWELKRDSKQNMYQIEHDVLFKSIRDGAGVNDGDRTVNSNLLGLMGRMSAYTGKKITSEMALNSREQLVPDDLTWDSVVEFRSVPVPGATAFV